MNHPLRVDAVIEAFRSWHEVAGIEWIPASVLAKELGLPNARALRGTGEEPGPIENLNYLILEKTGKIVISNTAKGYRLTCDSDEIKHAIAQLRAHSFSSLGRANRLHALWNRLWSGELFNQRVVT